MAAMIKAKRFVEASAMKPTLRWADQVSVLACMAKGRGKQLAERMRLSWCLRVPILMANYAAAMARTW